MNKKVLLGILGIFILMLFFPNSLWSQDLDKLTVGSTYHVVLKDGSELHGELISKTSDQIVIKTAAMGEVTLSVNDIDEIEETGESDYRKGKYWFPNPNPSKYLLGSSAIPPEKGSGYYQNTWVFFNSFNYAFTDFLSLSGGFEIFSIFAGSEGPYAFYLNPKVSFNVVDNLYLGGNVLYANTIRSIDEFGGIGTLNAIASYGTHNTNITASLGWGFAEGDFSSKPLITISGMVRASRRIGFVSENWIVPEVGSGGSYYGVFSYGIRFLGEKISVDLAFVNNPDIADVLIIGWPFLDFVVNF